MEVDPLISSSFPASVADLASAALVALTLGVRVRAAVRRATAGALLARGFVARLRGMAMAEAGALRSHDSTGASFSLQDTCSVPCICTSRACLFGGDVPVFC